MVNMLRLVWLSYSAVYKARVRSEVSARLELCFDTLQSFSPANLSGTTPVTKKPSRV